MSGVDGESAQGKILRIDVRGDSKELWAKLRSQLLTRIQAALDTTIDHEHGTTVKEELRSFTSHMMDYARRRLQREGLENDKIEAEVAEIYARRSSELANAELVSANAEAQRQQTALRELCKALALTRAVLAGEKDEECILFGKQIDMFLEIVKDLNLLK